MVQVHNLGFPRIGRNRELKRALESYWKGRIDFDELERQATAVRRENWAIQASSADLVPVGDFSLYDHVLDTSVMVGSVPDNPKDYFGRARGGEIEGRTVPAGEMTKWFDTNYHYIVPDLESGSPCPGATSRFEPNPRRVVEEIHEAHSLGYNAKPVILGPITWLTLAGSRRGQAARAKRLLPELVEVYAEILSSIGRTGVEWIQVDEPVLSTDLAAEWRTEFAQTYETLADAAESASESQAKILLATYFAPLYGNLDIAAALPVAGLHIDAVRAPWELESAARNFPGIVSAGVVNGRNVWRTDLVRTLRLLEQTYEIAGDRLWLAPSCSLLHVPIDLAGEESIDPAVRSGMAFAVQKLAELSILRRGLEDGREAIRGELDECHAALSARRAAPGVVRKDVRERCAAVTITPGITERSSSHPRRAELHRQRFGLGSLPTTTIGSFPQTQEIRKSRRQWKRGVISDDEYEQAMRDEIKRTIEAQEQLGLDVLVHGEPERNDMVEYFGERLDGYLFTSSGWVQSYGSRCVKPPVIYGDVARPGPITVEWTRYAQELTDRPVKGMVTGPITMLCWSFVRDDVSRREVALQLALAIRDEVVDLERAGIGMIQVDEPAFREGLPLRETDRAEYLEWAVRSFKVATSGVTDQTQIHTHMCYADFDEIIDSIAALDADVITMEAARSGMELLSTLESKHYPNEIGPGVYDIHSPLVPDVSELVSRTRHAAQVVGADHLWINPDCGLKTRTWPEVERALSNMVESARVVRASYARAQVVQSE